MKLNMYKCIFCKYILIISSIYFDVIGTPAVERDTGLVPSDSSPIDAMCEVTGGRSYCITSHRMLNQCIDSLVQKVNILLC